MIIATRFRYNEEVSFWEDNEELLIIDEFKELYNKDQSKDKINSSRLMWVLYFLFDYESRYAHLPLEMRITIVEGDYLKQKGYVEANKQTLDILANRYNDLQKDSEKRYLDTWQETVEKRRQFLQQTEYDTKTWRMLDEMLINSKQILAQKDEILERIRKNEGRVKGDLKISLLAKGDLVVERGKPIDLDTKTKQNEGTSKRRNKQKSS